MKLGFKRIFLLILILFVFIFGTLILSITVGFVFGFTKSSNMRELLLDKEADVPTQIFDRKGRLISELVGEQKREIIYFHELPIEIVSALMSREDPNFFYHSGFSTKATLRAIVFLGKRGGGSTISQQTAGVKFCDRRERTLTRKIKELWYSFNLERDLSKEEIVQLYLNEIYFGHGAYGIEAASQFFFHHSARELSLAEAALIVTPVSNPRYYSPLRYPDTSKQRQKSVLDKMVELDYIDKEVSDKAFNDFWNNFDRNRSPDETYHDISGANNRAPYFTDYIRSQLQSTLTGTSNIYKDGYIVETTLDLDYQQAAEEAVEVGMNFIDRHLNSSQSRKGDSSIKKFIPIVDMLCLATNIPGIDNYQARQDRKNRDNYIDKFSSSLSLLSLLTGNGELQYLSEKTNLLKSQTESKTEVQTSLITLENNTGRILTMIGGREYDNKFESAIFNRSTMGKISPGSSLKPLYYSAGISSRLITPATILDDSPVIFIQKGSDPYKPNNYMDIWRGPVTARYALKVSLNIPAIQVLDRVGYDLAIDRMTALLGLEEQKNDPRLFPRKYPLALGIIQVAPIDMARAFATFANRGIATEPHGIISIKDRNGNPLGQYGNIGIDLESDVNQQRDRYRIMPPDEAYVMVSLLKSTVSELGGFLYYHAKSYDDFDGMPMAGKTGTTQNWEDAWAVGFSPYMTTAVWFGFDEGSQSLGSSGGTGASLAGRSWANFMYKAHKELPLKEFYKPETGLNNKQVCTKTGRLARSSCRRTYLEIFLDGTEPSEFCQTCAKEPEFIEQEKLKIQFHKNLKSTSSAIGVSDELPLPSIDDLIQEAIIKNPGKFENIENINNAIENEESNEDIIILDENENSFWN